MRKEKIEKIFNEAMGYIPCAIEVAKDKADLVSVAFKRGKVDKLIVSSKAHFDDVCDCLESVYDSLRKAA